MSRSSTRFWTNTLRYFRRPSPSLRRTHRLRPEWLEQRAMLTTFFVDGELGDDSNPGTAAEPFATIQAAIDTAVDDGNADTIMIQAGRYLENLSIEDDDSLTLIGVTVNDEPVKVVAADSDENVVGILDATDVTIENLTITGGDDGINATDVGSLSLVDVVSRRNDGRGVDAQKVATLTISGGNYSNNGRDGIRLREEAETVIITGVTVHNNGDEGLELDNNPDEDPALGPAGTVDIVGSTFSQNADDGMKIVGFAEINLTDVTSTGNKDGDGLDIELAGDVTITGGTYSHNGDEGIEFDDTASGVLIGILVSHNSDDGIDIDTTGSLVLDAVISTHNKGNGLQVEAGASATDVVITGSLFAFNKESGIFIEEAGDIHISTTVSSKNVEHGLEVIASGVVTIDDISVFKKNRKDDIVGV